MNLKQISVTVLAKNSQQYLGRVLQALIPFGEVVLYDTGSTDQTLELAKAFSNVRIISAPFIGFGPTHNQASTAAQCDWILSVDSDEIVTPEMVQAIDRLSLDPQTVYSFPRHNYFNGRFIKGCGWYPDRQIRLYHRKNTRFSEALVHESIISDKMRIVALDAPIIHYSYNSIGDFLSKMQAYSTLFAQQNCGKKSSSLFKAISHGIFAFFKSYCLKKGMLDGYEGFVISLYNGHTAYYKYLKLKEANQMQKNSAAQ